MITRRLIKTVGTLTVSALAYVSGIVFGVGECGLSSNTGHMIMPSTNLCGAGYTPSQVQFDNERNTRSWSCSESAYNTITQCSAWLNTSNTFSPSCNNSLIVNNAIDKFPGNSACIYGVLSNRQVSLGGIATRQCSTNNQVSTSCGNVSLTNYPNNLGSMCNTSITNKTYDSTYQLLQNQLCQDGGMASELSTVSDRWKRKCGMQSCEALRSNKPMCGRAINQPRKSYPSSGICSEGIASTVKQSTTERGWICTTNLANIQQFNNSMCTYVSCVLNVLDFYNGKTAVCTAPRVVDGECKRSTQMDINGFSDPDQVVQAGLCETGVPSPLLPIKDTINKKRSRQCTSTLPSGTTTSTCYAKVRLPNVSVIYQPQMSNGTITAVTAVVTGFNNVYVTFDDPVNQYYRLFTQNGYFTFKYRDRAGNVGSIIASVDSIKNDAPSATVVMDPNTPTSGNITVSVTGFNRQSLPAVSFSGPCITNGNCIKNPSNHPYLFTITFKNNDTGLFTLADANGVTNTIPVAVTTIDRTAPLAQIQYDNSNPTNTGVIASVINPNEPITIINNSGQSGYLFTGNGSFDFKIADRAGNITTLTAKVTWINKTTPSATVIYSTLDRTKNDVVATLKNFTVPGTVVTNNGGSISHTFNYNKEFIFILKDPAGNVGSVKAKVDWIDKPITTDLTTLYTNKLCPDRTAEPTDTKSQIYNYYIHTVINNCLMKSMLNNRNNYRYFNPRQAITRGEYLTVIGRMMTLLSSYNGSLKQSLSPSYIGVTYNGIDESVIGEVDTWGLLLYSPLVKRGNKRAVESKKNISGSEAQKILEQALMILGNNTNSKTLIRNSGTVTRAQTAFAIGKIVSQYNHTALGNHHTFLSQLDSKLSTLSSPTEKQKFTVELIKKIKRTPSQSLYKVGIDRDILLQDLSSIALGTILLRKSRVDLDLTTVIDFLITKPSTDLPINNSNKTYVPSTTPKTSSNYFNFWSDISL